MNIQYTLCCIGVLNCKYCKCITDEKKSIEMLAEIDDEKMKLQEGLEWALRENNVRRF